MKQKKNAFQLPEGILCGHNCAEGCIYFNFDIRDSNGWFYCSLWGEYVDISEKHGRTCFWPSGRSSDRY